MRNASQLSAWRVCVAVLVACCCSANAISTFRAMGGIAQRDMNINAADIEYVPRETKTFVLKLADFSAERLAVLASQLEDENIILEGYLPPDSILVTATSQEVAFNLVEFSLQVGQLGYYAAKHKTLPEPGSASKRAEPQPAEQCVDALLSRVSNESQLAAALRGAFPRVRRAQVVARRLVRICCEGRCDDLVGELAAWPQILWIEPSISRFSTTALSDASLIWNAPAASKPVAFATFPLRGDGQVVSVADTGLDLNHCSFYDPNVTLVLDQRNDAHRKVLFYRALRDGSDVIAGHGSHVASIIAGACINPNFTTFDGIAAGAKIVFVDISAGGASVGSVVPPDDLQKDLYSVVYDQGARVHSDSWGADPQSQPTLQSFQIDDFLSSHQDFLIVRSAGNNGDHTASLVTHATAKNALTVAAAMGYREDFLASLAYRDFSLELGEIPFFCNANSSVCGQPISDALCCSVPVLADLCCLQNLTGQSAATPEMFNASNLADFSSKGPTQDLRIKPDVAGVGTWVIGAKADPTAAGPTTQFVAFSGTSQATPGIAGAAAVIREYLQKGYYPSGQPNASAVVPNPSASLLKAMIITSARPLDGYTVLWNSQTRLPYPSPYGGATFLDGFGKVALQNVLSFANTSSAPAFSLFIPNVPQDREIVAGENHTYCFQSPAADGQIAVTLVWQDPAALPIALYQLVNDLDLIVVLPNQTVYGNQPFDSSSPFDRINNVERVLANIPAGEDFSVEVRTHRVLSGSQNYSLIITAPAGTVRRFTGCRDCQPGTRLPCPVLHGIGEKKCLSSGRFSKCFATQCAKGYTLSSWSNTCRKFGDYYTIIGISSGVAVLLAMIVCVPIECCFRRRTRANDPLSFWEVYALIHPRVGWIVFGTVLSLLSAGASLFQPIFLGQLIERLPTTLRFSQVRYLFYYIIALNAAEYFLSFLGDFMMSLCAESLVYLIRLRLLYSALSQKFSLLELTDKGELNTIISTDPNFVVHFPTYVLNTVFSSLVKAVVGVMMMVIISWQLSVVFFAVLPVLIAIGWAYGRVAQPLATSVLQNLGTMGTVLYDILLNTRIIKLHHREIDEFERFKQVANSYYRITIRNMAINTLQATGKGALIQVIVVVLLWYGSILVIKPKITTGLLLAYFLYLSTASSAFTALLDLYPSYKSVLGSAERLYRVCDLVKVKSTKNLQPKTAAAIKPPKDEDVELRPHQATRQTRADSFVTDLPPLPVIRASPPASAGPVGLSLEKVSFSYAPGAPQVINCVSLTIAPGMITAFGGNSGCGKTTLLNMLAGLHTPTAGTVQYDGKASLGDAPVAVVEQQPRLLHRPLRDNVRYGKPKATDDEIVEALKKVGLGDLPSKLPEGLSTVVGENSAHQLSGGQKQRVAIARALLCQPRLMLMDEPTSELDPASKNTILELLKALRGTCTIVFITHDFTVINIADNIVILGDGNIREAGAREKLLATKNSLLRKFAAMQGVVLDEPTLPEASSAAPAAASAPAATGNQEPIAPAPQVSFILSLPEKSPRTKPPVSPRGGFPQRALSPRTREAQQPLRQRDEAPLLEARLPADMVRHRAHRTSIFMTDRPDPSANDELLRAVYRQNRVSRLIRLPASEDAEESSLQES